MTDPYAYTPISAEDFMLARTRVENYGECEWCTSTDFAPGSIYCKTCVELEGHGSYCERACGHTLPPHSTPTCRFCEKELLLEAMQGPDDLLSWPIELIRRLFRSEADLHEYLDAWGWVGEADDDRMILRRKIPKEE